MANGLGLGPIKHPLFFSFFFVQSHWSVVLFLRETHAQDQTWLVSSCCSCRLAARALACTFSMCSGDISRKKTPPTLSTDFAQSPSPPVSVPLGRYLGVTAAGTGVQSSAAALAGAAACSVSVPGFLGLLRAVWVEAQTGTGRRSGSHQGFTVA